MKGTKSLFGIKKSHYLKYILGGLRCFGSMIMINYILIPVEASELDRSKEFKLEESEVDNTLREHQNTLYFKTYNADKIVQIDTIQVAAYNPIEDRISIFKHGIDKRLYLGVYDGSSGFKCSDYISKNLTPLISKNIDSFNNNKDEVLYKDKLPRILKDSFTNLDDWITFKNPKNEVNQEKFDISTAGSCALFAVLDYGEIPAVTVANTGNCRAIVGRYNESKNGESNWEAIPLTQDHTFYNYMEVKRMEFEHKREHKRVIQNKTLFGNLRIFYFYF